MGELMILPDLSYRRPAPCPGIIENTAILAAGDQSRDASSSRVHQSRGPHSRRDAGRDAGRNTLAGVGRNSWPRRVRADARDQGELHHAGESRRVLGTGRIVSRGRSICFMEGHLYDEHGNLLATAMCNLEDWTTELGMWPELLCVSYSLLQHR